MKLVITRKEHTCSICYEKIEKGKLAVVSTEIRTYKGMFHYFRPRLRHVKVKVYYHVICALEKGLITKKLLKV